MMNNKRHFYRGKRVDNGEWIYGTLSVNIDGTPCINPNTYFVTKEFMDEDKLSVGYAIGEFFSVIPESIGQCTLFKDKKGNFIFEGDIVNEGLGVIYWCEKTAMFKVKFYKRPWSYIRPQNGEPLFLNSEIVWVVIGNVYDNKNLIDDK